MTSYIFFKTDGSFDYNSPFGSATCHCEDSHGFDFDIDTLDLKTLDGFGEFSDINGCETLEDLLNYVKSNIKFLDSTGTDEDVFDELIEALEEAISQKCA